MKLPMYLWRHFLASIVLLSFTLAAGARPIDGDALADDPPRGPYNFSSYLNKATLDDGLTHQFYLDTQLGVAKWAGIASSNGRTMTALSVPGKIGVNGTDYPVVVVEPYFAGMSSVHHLRVPDTVYEVSWGICSSFVNLDTLSLGNRVARIDASTLYYSNSYNSSYVRHIEFATPFPPELYNVYSSTSIYALAHVPEGSFDNYASLNTLMPVMEGYRVGKTAIHCDRPGYLASRLAATGLRLRQVNDLTVTGHLDQNDLDLIVNDLRNLTALDLSGCDITVEKLSNPKHMKAVTRLALPEGFTSIAGCDEMKQIEVVRFPASLKHIERYAFSNCKYLRNIIFNGNGLRSIEDCAFSGCLGMPRLLLPEGLEYIGGSAFSNWKDTLYVHLPYTLKLIGGDVFTHVRELVCDAVLPPVAISSYQSAICSKPSAVSLVVPRAGEQMYAESLIWSGYGQVTAYDIRPEYIATAGAQTLRFTDAPDYRPNLVLDHYVPFAKNGTGYWGAAVVPEDADLAFASVTMSCNVPSNPTSANGDYCTPFVAKGHAYADATTIDLTMRGSQWYYLCFPFSVRVSDILPLKPSTHVTVMAHDGYERSQDMTRYTSSWRSLGPDDVMEAYKGYALFPNDPTETYASTDVVLQIPAHDGLTAQNVYRTDAVSVPLELHPSEFAHNAHWSFVGNPYPCYYDISYLGTQQPIYIFDGVSFKTYRPGVDNLILPPYQGFFVQRAADPSAVTGSEGAVLTFDPAGRQTSYRKLTHQAPTHLPDGMESPFVSRDYTLTLTAVADSTLTDRTIIVVDHTASAAYEPQRDAVKFKAPLQLPPLGGELGASAASDGPSTTPSHSLELATLSDGVAYAINTRPATADAPLWLSVTAPAEGDYTLALAEGSLVVDDLFEGTTVTITPAVPYTFHTAAGSVTDRFRVSITPGRFTEGLDAFSIIVTQPGKLREELETYIGTVPYADIKCLTITGTLDSNDYYFIRTSLTSLVELDLRGTSTTDGTLYNEALYNLSALEYVLVPSSITSIGSYAFSNCKALKNADIPDGVVTVKDNAYKDCKALEEVHLPATVTSIGSNCFYGCTSLRDVTLSPALVDIPNQAFAYCSSLERIDVTEGIVRIMGQAFDRCTALTDITLPSTLAFIDYRAFDHITNFVRLRSHAVLPPFAPHDDLLSSRVSGSESNPDKVTLIVPQCALKAYLASPTYARFGVVKTFEETLPDYVPNMTANLAGRHFVDYTPDELSSFPALPTLDFLAVRPDAYDRGDYTTAYVCDDANANHRSTNASLTVVRGSEYRARNIIMSVLGFPCDQYVRWNSIVPHGSFAADAQHYELTCRGAHWNFVSLPCAVRVGDFKPLKDQTQWTIYAYEGERRAAADFQGAWRRLAAADVLEPGRGYILYGWASADTYTFDVEAPEPINFVGGEPASVPLRHYPAANPDNADWNLVSNPYLCFFDIRHLETTTPVTVWDDYSSHYHVYSPIDDAYVLRPMEAFFVQGTGEGAAQPTVGEGKRSGLTFDVEGLQACNCVRAIPATSRQRAAAPMQRRLCNVILSASPASASDEEAPALDRTRIVFNNSAHIGYEAQWDAAKFMSMDTTVPELYTLHDGIRYAINERPDGDFAVELGLRVTSDAPLTLSLAPGTPGSALLLDRLTGQTITLCAEEGKEASYTFSADPGTVEGRFLLTYVPDGDVEGIEDIALDEPWTCPHGNVFDLSGRPLPSSLSPLPSNGVTIDATGHKHIHR